MKIDNREWNGCHGRSSEDYRATTQLYPQGLDRPNNAAIITVNPDLTKPETELQWFIDNGFCGDHRRKKLDVETMPVNATLRSRLAEFAPYGLLVTRRWLQKKGISRHSLDNLVKSGQLVALVPGVYKRPETVLKWQGVISSLQRMGSDLIPGGLTALEQQGLVHYLPMSEQKTIHLYGYDSLPSWANKLGLPEKFNRHGNFRLWGERKEDRGGQSELFTVDLPWSDLPIMLRVSTPERAICEVLEDVPGSVSFEHAGQLGQGLPGLSPRRLQQILNQLKSVKVKRLFFWFAERQNHAWMKKLDPAQFDLGSGKRVLIKGGKLNKKYSITVPEENDG